MAPWIVLIGVSACAPPADTDPAADALTVDVDDELVRHFDDAALFCERRLFAASALTPLLTEMIGDQALMDFAARRLPGMPPITSGPHAGESVIRDTNIQTNSCVQSVSVQTGAGDLFSVPQDGLCRADLNYCLGMELGLHAQSLPGGSAYTQLKAAILRRARERLQASALEYIEALGFYERACVSEPDPPLANYAPECSRLVPASGESYLPVAHDRLVESVSQIVSFAQAEAGLRVDAGDRALQEAPLDDVDVLDGSDAAVEALFGPDGSRTAAVSVLYGPPVGVTFERRPNERRRSPVALPRYAPTDERAAQALELMRRYRVPLSLESSSPDSIPHVADLGLPGFAADVVVPVLDHRMAAERYLPPYERTDPPDPATDLGTILRSRRPLSASELATLSSAPFPAHQSLLRSEHQLTFEDVQRALILAEDVYETRFGSFVLEPQEVLAGGGHRLALAEASASPRPPQMLAAAFSDEPAGATISADALVPLLGPLPRTTGTGGPRDWYGWDLTRVDGSQVAGIVDDEDELHDTIVAPLGAAGALHLLRVHLLRLATLPGTFIDSIKIEQARDLIEHAIGAVWTEYDESPTSTCACFQIPPEPPPDPPSGPPPPPPPPTIVCPNRDALPLSGPCASAECACPAAPTPGTAWHWDLYYPLALEPAYEGGTPVVVSTIDDVRCLVEERVPGSDAPCELVAGALEPIGSPTFTRIKRQRRTYRLPSVGTTLYILWRSSDGRHRLLDVVPPHGIGVHPLGGVFLDAAASAWSYDPWRPARPSISASGSPRDLVPPLESELISDGDDYEDSFARYLADARAAVARARDRLVESRDEELLARQDELSTQARLDEAALVETGELADLCGDRPGCRMERAGAVTLQSLGIVGDPPPPPDLTGSGYADCDEVFDGLFSDFTETIASGTLTEDDDAQLFVRTHLNRALGCALHRYLSELAALRIDGLPVAVVDALATGRNAEFTIESGALRELLIEIFVLLDAVRSDLRRLQAHRSAAEILIGAAAEQVSFANRDQLERDLCVWGFALGVVSDAASIITSAAGASQSFSSASTDIGHANRFAEASPQKARAVYQQGMEHVGGGLRSTGRGFEVGGGLANRAREYVSSDECMGQDAGVTAGFQAAQEVAGALQTIASLARSAHDGSRSTYFAISSLDGLERRAQFAGRRREVARLMAESDSLADVPEWHSLRSFHQRRAEASLQRAQHAVFVARRAIEFRLAVDLSTMSSPEPLTPAPSSWADSLFDTGAAVLAVPEDEGEVSIAAEELDLYLSRLERFVDGYPIARRFRDGSDVQVLDVGEMNRTGVSLGAMERMLFKCSEHPIALLGGRLPGTEPGTPPCAGLGDVEHAEILFQVPAEFDAYLADRLAAGSFNYRHELFALNLIGSAVLDCEHALDPGQCYEDGNVPYTLRHEGPFPIENFDRELHTFFMEPGVIQAGRALVAERTLTTPLSSADRSLVATYYRQELRGRPLSGRYTLHVDGRPEIQWANLERIQILLGYRYWTRQE